MKFFFSCGVVFCVFIQLNSIYASTFFTTILDFKTRWGTSILAYNLVNMMYEYEEFANAFEKLSVQTEKSSEKKRYTTMQLLFDKNKLSSTSYRALIDRTQEESACAGLKNVTVTPQLENLAAISLFFDPIEREQFKKAKKTMRKKMETAFDIIKIRSRLFTIDEVCQQETGKKFTFPRKHKNSQESCSPLLRLKKTVEYSNELELSSDDEKKEA